MTFARPLHLAAAGQGARPSEVRRWQQAVVADRAGVFGTGELAVAQTATPSMAVTVAAGRAVVTGTHAATQGSYFVDNDAPVTVTLDTADPTHPRIDLVVVRVRDSDYAGSTDEAAVEAVTGTPAASPVAPAAPATSLVLAEVTVGAGAVTVTTANLTNRRTVISGAGAVDGLLTLTSADPGLVLSDTDDGTRSHLNHAGGGLAVRRAAAGGNFSTLARFEATALAMSVPVQLNGQRLYVAADDYVEYDDTNNLYKFHADGSRDLAVVEAGHLAARGQLRFGAWNADDFIDYDDASNLFRAWADGSRDLSIFEAGYLSAKANAVRFGAWAGGHELQRTGNDFRFVANGTVAGAGLRAGGLHLDADPTFVSALDRLTVASGGGDYLLVSAAEALYLDAAPFQSLRMRSNGAEYFRVGGGSTATLTIPPGLLSGTGTDLVLTSANTIARKTSSEAVKADIVDTPRRSRQGEQGGAEDVLALKPRKFRYRDEVRDSAGLDQVGAGDGLDHGFIAEEVAQVASYYATWDVPAGRVGLISDEFTAFDRAHPGRPSDDTDPDGTDQWVADLTAADEALGRAATAWVRACRDLGVDPWSDKGPVAMAPAPQAINTLAVVSDLLGVVQGLAADLADLRARLDALPATPKGR